MTRKPARQGKAKLPRISEAAFTRQVIMYARLKRWLVAHFRPGRTVTGWRTPVQGDGAGYPDLTLCRGPQIVFVELKSASGQLTPAQVTWADALRKAGAAVYLWRPDSWDEIQRVLE